MSGVAHFFVVVGGSKIHERMAHFFIDIYNLYEYGRITTDHVCIQAAYAYPNLEWIINFCQCLAVQLLQLNVLRLQGYFTSGDFNGQKDKDSLFYRP